MMATLRLRPKRINDRANHIDPVWRNERCVIYGSLLDKDKLPFEVPACAAVFVRPCGGEPAFVAQDFLPANEILLFILKAAATFQGNVLWQVRPHEIAHF